MLERDMNKATLLLIAAGALSGAVVAQTPQPSQQPATPRPAAEQSPRDQSTAPAPSREGQSRDSTSAQSSRQASSQQPSRDPSSQQGRPGASYPNPSGQDTKTDAAARQRTEKGHDDASDASKVKPTPSAGPSGGQDTYAGALGKKSAPQSECDQAKTAQQNSNAANSGAQRKSEKCVGAQASDDKADRRATAPPPGATAPIHPK
jgi:hypothetical protein